MKIPNSHPPNSDPSTPASHSHGTSGLAAVVVTKNNESPTGKGKAYGLGLPISNHKGMENAPMANVTAKVDKNTQRANRLDKIISSIEKMGEWDLMNFCTKRNI